jgi:hypothetical protein
MAFPTKDPRWVIAALIMIVATSFGFLGSGPSNTTAVAHAQMQDNDASRFSMVRGLIANHEKLIDKQEARVADLEKVLTQAKKDLANYQNRTRFWRQILSTWELQTQRQDRGMLCVVDEPTKSQPVRRVVRKIVGYDTICRGNYCERVPRYEDVEIVEQPTVELSSDQPPACDDPSVATTSIVRGSSSSDSPPGCPCEVCECENCIYDQESMTSFLAGESPAKVKGFRPVRSFLESRPLRSFLQARPVRSFLGRLFGR